MAGIVYTRAVFDLTYLDICYHIPRVSAGVYWQSLRT